MTSAPHHHKSDSDLWIRELNGFRAPHCPNQLSIFRFLRSTASELLTVTNQFSIFQSVSVVTDQAGMQNIGANTFDFDGDKGTNGGIWKKRRLFVELRSRNGEFGLNTKNLEARNNSE